MQFGLGSTTIIPLSLFLLISALQFTYGIKCYQCKSIEQSCRNLKESNLTSIECASKNDTGCRKTTRTSDGTVERACAGIVEKDNKCDVFDEMRDKGTICYCIGDSCNGSPHKLCPLSLALFGFGLTAFYSSLYVQMLK